MEYFILDDIKSSDFGIYIINANNYLQQSYIPSKRTITEEISNYDGLRYIDQDYDVKQIPLELLIKDTSQSNLNKIARWLGKKGQMELTLSYESHKVYTVTIEKSVDLNNLTSGGITSVKFVAHYPLANSKFSTMDIINDSLIYDSMYYYNSGLLYKSELPPYEFTSITSITNMNIYNGSNISGSRPNIVIDGSADDITIYQYKDENRTVLKDYITYGNFNGLLEVNCLLRNCFLNTNVSNATFNGRYFELDTDLKNKNSGVVIDYTIDTVTLDDKASSNNGEYIGNHISVGNDLKKSWYKIISYDGSTKIATVDGGIVEDIVETEYGIYNIIDGINYFTIDGTNMDINSIKFDFKYLYI